MKKLTIILTSLFMVTTLAACNQSKESDISKALKELRAGVALKGQVKQVAQKLTGQHGALTGEQNENIFDLDIAYQTDGENGYEINVTGYNDKELKDSYTYYENSLVEGEDGFAYYYDLNYDNTVEKHKFTTTDTDSGYLNYGLYFTNPFELIVEEDFTLISDNTYSLAKDKATLLASNLCGVIDQTFYEAIDKCTFTFENGSLKSFSFNPIEVEVAMTDLTIFANAYFLMNSYTTFSVENAGSDVKIYKPAPRQGSEAHTKLQNALNKIQDNFTLTRSCDSTVDGVYQGNETVRLYYTGSDLYYGVGIANEARDTDFVLHASEGTRFLKAYGYDETYAEPTFSNSVGKSTFASINEAFTYPEILPIISDVKAEIFDYNAERDVYTICDDMVSYIGAFCFMPPLASDRTVDGYGTACEISLTASGNIDTITIKTDKTDFFNSYQYTFILYFDNVGSTTLPFNITLVD